MKKNIFIKNHNFVYAAYETTFGQAYICKNCQCIYVDKDVYYGKEFFWDKNGYPINNNNSVVVDCNEVIIRDIIK